MGSIGVGKTTFINEFKKSHPDYEVYGEDAIINSPAFKKLYESEFNDDFSFEIAAMKARIDMLKNSSPNSIFERSIDDSYSIFGMMKYEQGKITLGQLNELKKLYDEGSKIRGKDYKIIFIPNIPIDEQLDRIKQRGRKGEENISKKYLSDLNNSYELFILCHPEINEQSGATLINQSI